MAKDTKERLLELFLRFLQEMDNGTIKKCEPETLAFSYTAPITVLAHFCDRNSDRENEAMERLMLIDPKNARRVEFFENNYIWYPVWDN